MHPLIGSVAAWRNYDQLRKSMAERGFFLHETFRKIMLSRCSCEPEALERYWRECAIEYVTAAGKTDINLRHFEVKDGYRSQWLDDLAKSLRSDDKLERHLSLFSPLREIDRQRLKSPDFGLGVTSLMSCAKRTEVIAKNPSDTFPKLRERQGQFAALRTVSKQMGFESGRDFVRKNKDKLSLSISADLQGSIDAVGLQFDITLNHSDDNAFLFHIQPAKILPGLAHYSIGEDNDDIIHGLKAYCTFCDLLLFSLNSQNTSGLEGLLPKG